MYSYQTKYENKERKVCQLYPQNVKSLKNIRLHTKLPDGTEDRSVNRRIRAETEFVIDTEQSWVRSSDGVEMVYASYNQQEGYVKNIGSNWEKTDLRREASIISELYQKFAASILPIQLEGLDKIQHSIHVNSGHGIAPDSFLWEKIFTSIRDTAIPRILLKYPQGISTIALSGGDPHRDGNTPLIVTLTGGQKIVYKPGSLFIDQSLFGDIPQSVANSLSSPQQNVPSYRIDPAHPTYGDMEFLETDIPASQADIIDIFKSIGANMAMSYFFGLDDLHKENFILQKNKIQLIDMEVVTGVFGNPVLEGWRALLFALNSKIFWTSHPELQPQEQVSKTAVEEAFRSIYTKAKTFKIQPSNAADDRPVLPNLQSILTASVRFVPFATADFYQFIPKAKEEGGLEAWQRYIDGLADSALPRSVLRAYSKRLILRDSDTYTALHTSNIPIFMRKLDVPDVVYNSSGMPILLSGRLNPATGIVDPATTEQAPIIHSTMEQELISKWPAANAEDNAYQPIFQQFWGIIKSIFYMAPAPH